LFSIQLLLEDSDISQSSISDTSVVCWDL